MMHEVVLLGALVCYMAAFCRATPINETVTEEMSEQNLVEQSCVTSTTMTSKQIEDILNMHNKKRMLPRASNMRELVWSDDLAGLAQKVAEENANDGCQMKHAILQDCFGNFVGQNLYFARKRRPFYPPKFKVEKAVKRWYDEVRYYTYAGYTHNPRVGHYTQVVWAHTSEVGCGYATCQTGSKHNIIIACDYRSPGNWKNQYPYIQGRRGSDCPNGTKFQRGLCVNI